MLRNIRSNRGFTLMEMLIVVAIIAVLVAIAIPVFTSQLAKAREATCQANQRSLQAAVAASWMSDASQDNGKAVDAGCRAMGISSSVGPLMSASFSVPDCSLCPEGGTYTISFAEGAVLVSCSIHYATGIPEAAEEIADIIKTFGQADSGAGTVTASILEALKAKGLDISELDAKSWAWRPSKDYPKFYWSAVDISDSSMSGKDGIPLMSYNPDSGKYMVYTGKVGFDNEFWNKNYYTNFSKVTDGLSYEEANAKYQELLNNYK